MTFNVVFKGILPGTDPEQAKQSFAAIFGLDAEKVDRIFASSNLVIKPNVSDDLAQKFVEKLTSIGVQAAAVAVESNLELSLEPITTTSEENLTGAESSGFDSPSSAYITPAQAAAIPQSQVKPFVFTGVGGEYFKIWIVNILLTIVTLGIYSAWAKVRNKRYFYGNTSMDGVAFEYTANPVKILIGRAIAVGFYIAFIAASQYSPTAALILLLVLFLLIPFIVVSSLRFNARSSSYRNVSFRFHGGYWQAVVAFVLWPILAMLTLTILLPFAWKKQMEFMVSNHAYGTEKFELNTEVGPFYGIYLILIGISMVFGIAFFLVAMIFGGIAVLGGGDGGGMIATFAVLYVLMMLLYVGFIIFVQSYISVSMANIKYQNTRLVDHGFQSDWKVMPYAKIYFVNTLLTVLTLGLYIPFAKVRMAAYMAENTQFVAAGDLNQFAAAEQEQVSTLAEGVSDIFEFDISV
jgi:uncharacterized membrane protein YjgN (DUF898 family)